ncbi:MAG: asparagine synthase C-terminal domain-containing protein [Cuniculiplasma sp.]
MELHDHALKLIQMLKAQESWVKNAAFALSGGVDSSLLFQLLGMEKRPYIVGVDNSQDLEFAMRYCNFLNISPERLVVTESEIDEFSGIVKKIDPKISFLDLGFETVLAILLARIREERLVTGQGADEIFYGYSKFRDGRAMDNRSSLEKLFKVTLPREERIADYFGKTLITPYLNASLVSYFANLSVAKHIRGNENKIILREAGKVCGLPEFVYNRSKKAAQYGSGVKRVQEKLFIKKW